MNKAPRKRVTNSKVKKPNITPTQFRNWLGNTLQDWGIPAGCGTQLNQVDTLWKNLRWYLISNLRQILSEAYVEHGLIQRLVDMPVNDGLRGGVSIKTKQLEPEQVDELSIRMEREGDLRTLGQAGKWERLFGGAGVLILNGQDPKTPLDIDTMGEGDPLEFRDCDMWELYWTKQNTMDYSVVIDNQEFVHPEFYDYYGHKVHFSRVMKLVGLKAPSFIRPRLRGWGFSIVEVLVNSINQYLKSNNLIFEVLDEFKVDYYRLDGLANTLLSPDGGAQVQNRVQEMNRSKNYLNAAVMDSKDEWEHKQISFSGLAEMKAEFRMQIASDMCFPISKIFGVASTGFSSGEDDIENYNAMVESSVREPFKFHILKMIELRSKQMFGYIPDDLAIEFKPLRVLGAEAEENVKTQKFNRVLSAANAGLMTVEEFKHACNQENLLSIQLDPSIDRLEVAQGGEDGEGAPEGGAPKSSTTAKEAK